MFERTFSFWRRLVGKAPAETDSAQTDRRLWVRYPADLAAQVQLSSVPVQAARVSARVRDISLGGANLLVDAPIETGQLVTLELPPTSEGENHTVLACVVRAKQEAGGQWALGCVFSRELTDEDLEGFGAKAVRHTSSDKRTWMRFNTNLQARFQKVGDPENKSHGAQLMNLSASGIGLLVTTPVDAGALLSVDLISANGQVTRTILACVVHTTQADNEWALGCNFIRQLSEEDLQDLLK